MNIAKYMEAARGPANVAARGAISSVPGPGGVRASIGRHAMTPGSPSVNKAPIKGSSAGLESGKSAWIQMNGSGYQRRPHPNSVSEATRPTKPFRPSMGSPVQFTNYTRAKYHGLSRDQDL